MSLPGFRSFLCIKIFKSVAKKMQHLFMNLIIVGVSESMLSVML